ncbi:MAG: hypothetical protein LDL06_02685, partial [Candidatus Nitrosotenuis sp.]|nr:hypothetical protein [Candidatus Nitrosotenuis sp.]
ENLPIKLKRKDNSPGIDLRIKKKIRVLLPKEKQSESQPYIEGDTLNAVIDLIRNQGRSFELTPKVFSTLEEEWLRDIILSMLNAVLEGGATGETFVKRGKTDIHLKLNVEGGILSAECKFWGGEKKYQETIDQHFGYLTWKQDYAIQITFSKNVDFSSVINNSIKATKEHPTYVEGSFRQVDKSYFITSHILLGDSEKRVEVHHFLFDLHV